MFFPHKSNEGILRTPFSFARLLLSWDHRPLIQMISIPYAFSLAAQSQLSEVSERLFV